MGTESLGLVPAEVEAVFNSGDGFGYGYGYGSGYGSGYCMDRIAYCRAILSQYARPDMVVGFWRSDADGRPVNGGGGGCRQVGLIERVGGPLRLCTNHALHATVDPVCWDGPRWWIVGLRAPVLRQDDKLGALEREILHDLGRCPFVFQP